MPKRTPPRGTYRDNLQLSFAADDVRKGTNRSQEQVAVAMGINPKTLTKYFSGGRSWTSDMLFGFCQATGISADEIGGIRRRWDPRTDQAKVFSDFFGEHTEPNHLVCGYLTILPASKLPKNVQEEKHKSVFRRMKDANDPEGMAIEAAYDAFGVHRQGQCSDGTARARERLYIQTRDLERLVHRTWPYETLTDDAPVSAMEFLSERIASGVVEIRILCTDAMPESLKRRLAPYESLVSFGENATVEIMADYVAYCSIATADIARQSDFFNKLEKYVIHDTSKKAMTKVVLEYRSDVT